MILVVFVVDVLSSMIFTSSLNVNMLVKLGIFLVLLCLSSSGIVTLGPIFCVPWRSYRRRSGEVCYGLKGTGEGYCELIFEGFRQSGKRIVSRVLSYWDDLQ